MFVLHVYITWYCMIYNVNGVVYFCVTCVNASRILGDQHGIVCGIVLYYMYVVLYRTFASIIPA